MMSAAKYAKHLISQSAAPGEDVLEVYADGVLLRVSLLGQIATRVVWEAPTEVSE